MWLLKRGSSRVCELWSVAEPSQNKKREARPDKTEGGKRCVIARDDDLDTGEELPINALLELTNESPTNKLCATKQTPQLASCPSHAFKLRAPGLCVWLGAIATGCAPACLLLGIHFSPHHIMRPGTWVSFPRVWLPSLRMIHKNNRDYALWIGRKVSRPAISSCHILFSPSEDSVQNLLLPKARPTLIDHIVAVSLWDFSLWAIFDGGMRIR